MAKKGAIQVKLFQTGDLAVIMTLFRSIHLLVLMIDSK